MTRNQKPCSPPARFRGIRRRASVYLHVLFVSLIVSVLGLTAMTSTRMQRRTQQCESDVVEARLYAQAAIRLGMLRVESDPDWRFNRSHGIWEANVPVGAGTYTLEGRDPSDGDLSDAPEDPLVLIGTGAKGRSIHKVQITLAPVNRGFTALRAAMHAGRDLDVTSATLNCDQTVSANRYVDAWYSSIPCDVQAVSLIRGTPFEGDAVTGMEPRTMPNTTSAFDYYSANGTWIHRDSLPLGYANVLRNPGIENGLADWSGDGVTLQHAAAPVHSGTGALLATNRNSHLEGPEQNVTQILENGVAYEMEAWVRTVSDVGMGLRLGLQVTAENGTNGFWSHPVQVNAASGWQVLRGTVTPAWSGNLESATLRIASDSGPIADFCVDDLVLKQAGQQRTIHRAVLSPNSNPFGAATNPKGIYLIDLAGRKIVIKSSRIVGTLVLIEPDGASALGDGGPLHLEPAVAGLPVLLVKNGVVTVNPSNRGLNEAVNQVNFNPAGTPYAGESDGDQTDILPSEISGLIYGTGDIFFRNQPVIRGAVIAGNNIDVRDTTLNLVHDPGYFFNPPPGFAGPEEIRILLDSVRKPLN